MVQYKLYYFNVRGRGELARLIMHAAGVPFEDFRFERDVWPTIKPNMPFGNIPALEIDGTKMLGQSHTVARYLARQHGLAGKNDWEAAQADMYVDCIYDLHREMRTVIWEKDEVVQKENFDKLYPQFLEPNLVKIEADLAKNGTGYLVGDSLTWADIAYYGYLTIQAFSKFDEIVMSSSRPHIKQLMERVAQVPGIKSYIAVRPVTSG